MVTVRQIEKLWNARKYSQLLASLLISRPESALAEELGASGSLAAAAMAMIRLDELNQTQSPIFGKFIRAILAARQGDGGWNEIAPTALCLRALMIDQGRGAAVERGLIWLAQLQQPTGLWPRVPLRRMPADIEVSAFVLLQLGQHEPFQNAVSFDAATAWFEENTEPLSPAAQTLWAHAKLRCHVHTPVHAASNPQPWMWS